MDNKICDISKFEFRKFSDVNREHPLFEVVMGETVIVDISMSDEGIMEIAFHEGASNLIFDLTDFVKLIEIGKKLVNDEL